MIHPTPNGECVLPSGHLACCWICIPQALFVSIYSATCNPFTTFTFCWICIRLHTPDRTLQLICSGFRGIFFLQVLPRLPAGHRVLCNLQADWRCRAAHLEVQDGQLRILLPQRMPKHHQGLRLPQDTQVCALLLLHALSVSLVNSRCAAVSQGGVKTSMVVSIMLRALS